MKAGIALENAGAGARRRKNTWGEYNVVVLTQTSAHY
jgi:hypothetical protein